MYELSIDDVTRICKKADIKVFGTSSVSGYERVYAAFHSDASRCRTGDFIENAESFIIFGLPYRIRSFKALTNKRNKAFIAPMAKEYDYHAVMKRRGDILASEIRDFLVGEGGETRPGCFEYKCFTDDYRLSDRLLAFSSGIGKFGKNAFIINDTYGTAFHIGGIITNLRVEPSISDIDRHIKNPYFHMCNKCVLCVNNCPNKAIETLKNVDIIIDPSLLINRDRCISAISQKKGDLSYREKEMIRKKKVIYGCDECQIACPENTILQRKLECESNPSVISGSDGETDLEEFLSVEKSKFRKIFKDTGFSWRGYDTLMRNAKIIKGED